MSFAGDLGELKIIMLIKINHVFSHMWQREEQLYKTKVENDRMQKGVGKEEWRWKSSMLK